MILKEFEIFVVFPERAHFVLELVAEHLDLPVDFDGVLHVRGDGRKVLRLLLRSLLAVRIVGGLLPEYGTLPFLRVSVLFLLLDDLGFILLLVLDPFFLLKIDDLPQTHVRDRLLIQVYLLLVFELKQPVLGDDDLGVHVNAGVFFGEWIVRLLALRVIAAAQAHVLARMLDQVGVVVVEFLLHESLLNNDRENVADDGDRDKYEGEEVDLRVDGVDLHHVLVGVPHHVRVDHREQRVAAHREVRESATFPKQGHTEECVANKNRTNANKSIEYKSCAVFETREDGFVGLQLHQVLQELDPRAHAPEAKDLVGRDNVQLVPENRVEAANDLGRVREDRGNHPKIEELQFFDEAEITPIGLLHQPLLQLLGIPPIEHILGIIL